MIQKSIPLKAAHWISKITSSSPDAHFQRCLLSFCPSQPGLLESFFFFKVTTVWTQASLNRDNSGWAVWTLVLCGICSKTHSFKPDLNSVACNRHSLIAQCSSYIKGKGDWGREERMCGSSLYARLKLPKALSFSSAIHREPCFGKRY